MKILKGVLLSMLAANVAAAQPVSAVSPDNFTTDPLFQHYISDHYQMSRAMQDSMGRMMTDSIPAEVKTAAPALPGCIDEMRKALGDNAFIVPLMSKLRNLNAEERGKLAALTQFLHTPEGSRLIALNHQAMAVADKPDANGMPQSVSGRDSKLGEMKTLLESQPQPNTLQNTVYNLNIYMEEVAEAFSSEGGIQEAQKKVFASPACTALQQQLDAYDKAHPRKK